MKKKTVLDGIGDALTAIWESDFVVILTITFWIVYFLSIFGVV